MIRHSNYFFCHPMTKPGSPFGSLCRPRSAQWMPGCSYSQIWLARRRSHQIVLGNQSLEHTHNPPRACREAISRITSSRMHARAQPGPAGDTLTGGDARRRRPCLGKQYWPLLVVATGRRGGRRQGIGTVELSTFRTYRCLRTKAYCGTVPRGTRHIRHP